MACSARRGHVRSRRRPRGVPHLHRSERLRRSGRYQPLLRHRHRPVRAGRRQDPQARERASGCRRGPPGHGLCRPGDLLARAGPRGHHPPRRTGGPPAGSRLLRGETIPPPGRIIMIKKILTLVLFGLFVLAPLAAPPAARAAVSSQKEINVAPGETQEEIISFGGHVLIEGKVRGDVVVIGGSITVSGEVGQSVVGIGSRIVVRSTASIAKDLSALGGTLEKEPGCTIGGDTIYFQTRELGDRLFRDGHLFKGAFSLSLIPIIVAIKL